MCNTCNITSYRESCELFIKPTIPTHDGSYFVFINRELLESRGEGDLILQDDPRKTYFAKHAVLFPQRGGAGGLNVASQNVKNWSTFITNLKIILLEEEFTKDFLFIEKIRLLVNTVAHIPERYVIFDIILGFFWVYNLWKSSRCGRIAEDMRHHCKGTTTTTTQFELDCFISIWKHRGLCKVLGNDIPLLWFYVRPFMALSECSVVKELYQADHRLWTDSTTTSLAGRIVALKNMARLWRKDPVRIIIPIHDFKVIIVDENDTSRMRNDMDRYNFDLGIYPVEDNDKSLYILREEGYLNASLVLKSSRPLKNNPALPSSITIGEEESTNFLYFYLEKHIYIFTSEDEYARCIMGTFLEDYRRGGGNLSAFVVLSEEEDTTTTEFQFPPSNTTSTFHRSVEIRFLSHILPHFISKSILPKIINLIWLPDLQSKLDEGSFVLNMALQKATHRAHGNMVRSVDIILDAFIQPTMDSTVPNFWLISSNFQRWVQIIQYIYNRIHIVYMSRFKAWGGSMLEKEGCLEHVILLFNAEHKIMDYIRDNLSPLHAIHQS